MQLNNQKVPLDLPQKYILHPLILTAFTCRPHSGRPASLSRTSATPVLRSRRPPSPPCYLSLPHHLPLPKVPVTAPSSSSPREGPECSAASLLVPAPVTPAGLHSSEHTGPSGPGSLRLPFLPSGKPLPQLRARMDSSSPQCSPETQPLPDYPAEAASAPTGPCRNPTATELPSEPPLAPGATVSPCNSAGNVKGQGICSQHGCSLGRGGSRRPAETSRGHMSQDLRAHTAPPSTDRPARPWKGSSLTRLSLLRTGSQGDCGPGYSCRGSERLQNLCPASPRQSILFQHVGETHPTKDLGLDHCPCFLAPSKQDENVLHCSGSLFPQNPADAPYDLQAWHPLASSATCPFGPHVPPPARSSPASGRPASPLLALVPNLVAHFAFPHVSRIQPFSRAGPTPFNLCFPCEPLTSSVLDQ